MNKKIMNNKIINSKTINKLKKLMKNLINDFINDEAGIGVVEIILILVILIGLVIIFKTQIEALVNSIFNSITQKSGQII